MLSFLLAAAAPVKAGTVHFADTVRLLPGGGRVVASDVRLRVAPQTGTASTAAQQQQTGQQRGGAPSSSPQQTGSNTAPGGGTTATTGPADTTLSQSGGGQVETVDLGDVTGTVCDCGEIPQVITPGGGFPLWPFLGLLGVPLAFIPGGDGDRTPNPPTGPTPAPPSTPVPEPATLLLFGTSLLALGAGARRRLSRRREDETAVVVAEEVI